MRKLPVSGTHFFMASAAFLAVALNVCKPEAKAQLRAETIKNGRNAKTEADLQHGSYFFFRIPISVLPKFSMARSAAGVSTALSWEVGAGLTEEASASPVAAWLSALPSLGPEEPPVPLMVCPVDKVLPA